MYVELSVRAPASAEATIVAAIANSRGLGAWVEPEGVFRAYFTNDVEDPLSRFDRAWRALTGEGCPYDIECSELEDEDWSARWRASLRPIEITPRLWVAPPASRTGVDSADPTLTGRTIVWIEPGLGFGTGSHPTTRALLRWLDAAPVRETVLDVGTGSGILAIAALALGAVRCVGLDVDFDAVESALANARRNGLADSLDLVIGPIDALDEARRFDRVLANLDAVIFDADLDAIVRRCSPGGDLGVAGLLESDRHRFLSRAEALGLRTVDERFDVDTSLDDTWWSAWFERSEAGS